MDEVSMFYRRLGNQIAKEERMKLSQIERAERILALWEIESAKSSFKPRFKERGDGIAANLRGTVKGFPDSMLCASLTSDLEWCLQKGNELPV